MSEQPILAVEGLSIGYYGGRVKAVTDVSLAVPEHGFLAIIGPNGAGKSSLLRATAGLLGRDVGAIRAGRIRFRGQDITGRKPHKIAAAGLALVPEADKVFLELTANEHFRIARPRGQIASEHAAAISAALDLFPDLREHCDRTVGTFSGGQRQMLAIATALIGQPSLLMVDEFSQGLAPIVVAAVGDALREINGRGTAVVVVEQNPRLALDLAEQVMVMDGGRLVASGRSCDLTDSTDLIGAYLGTSPDGPAR